MSKDGEERFVVAAVAVADVVGVAAVGVADVVVNADVVVVSDPADNIEIVSDGRRRGMEKRGLLLLPMLLSLLLMLMLFRMLLIPLSSEVVSDWHH